PGRSRMSAGVDALRRLAVPWCVDVAALVLPRLILPHVARVDEPAVPGLPGGQRTRPDQVPDPCRAHLPALRKLLDRHHLCHLRPPVSALWPTNPSCVLYFDCSG